jgi:hypothetical protein
VYKQMPPWAVCDKQGKPLLSWRVLILPYIEQAPLYNAFKLDEPWDGPNNIKLLDMMPDVYAAPGIKTKEPGRTFYQGFVGKGAGWEHVPKAAPPFGASGFPLQSITDGTSNTIMVVEAGEPVPWTKPADLAYTKGQPLPKIGGVFKDRAHAAMFDGRVVIISLKARPEVLEAAVTRAGGEVLPPNWTEGK